MSPNLHRNSSYSNIRAATAAAGACRPRTPAASACRPRSPDPVGGVRGHRHLKRRAVARRVNVPLLRVEQVLRDNATRADMTQDSYTFKIREFKAFQGYFTEKSKVILSIKHKNRCTMAPLADS